MAKDLPSESIETDAKADVPPTRSLMDFLKQGSTDARVETLVAGKEINEVVFDISAIRPEGVDFIPDCAIIEHVPDEAPSTPPPEPESGDLMDLVSSEEKIVYIPKTRIC